MLEYNSAILARTVHLLLAYSHLPRVAVCNFYSTVQYGFHSALTLLSSSSSPHFNSMTRSGNASSPKDYEKFGDNLTSTQTFLVRKDMYEALGKPDMLTPEGFLKTLEDAKKMFPDINAQPLIPLGIYDFHEKGNASLEH